MTNGLGFISIISTSVSGVAKNWIKQTLQIAKELHKQII